MDKIKIRNIAIAATILTLLLVSSFAVLGNAELVKESSYATPLSPTTDYGDIMQYDWPQSGYDEGLSSGSPGPGPDKADVLWKVSTGGNSPAVVFDGKAFVSSGTTVYAYNALTGALIYESAAPDTPSISSRHNIFKIDDTYFLTQGSTGITVRKISDGSLAWSYDFPEGTHGMPGSGSYFSGRYSTSMKMWLMMYSDPSYDDIYNQHAGVIAIDLSNPAVPQTQPAWNYKADMSSELLCTGDGMAFLGSTEGDIIALNAQGQVAWQSPLLGGVAQQVAMYFDGKLYCSAVSWYLTCFDAQTGAMLWQTFKGIRAFTAYHGCIGAGMIFDETDELDPYGSVGAWDLETGERIWKNAGYFNIRYDTMAYADGKVYGIKCDRAGQTSTLVMPGPSFSCWDAYTGEELWNLPGTVFAVPTIAYGNLYGVANGYLYCIGGSPKDWAMGMIGNVEQPRIAVGQQGPTDISTPKWYFQTNGDTFSNPAIANGKVYFGSADKNFYCLNAYTGEKIWSFTIGFYARSSPAVYAGKVFTGADDGYFYGLDANTGTQLWKTSAGGFFPYINPSNEAKASSSPIVVNNMIYCGSKDGKLYCLNTDGVVQWTYQTGGPILGSPGYANGVIYINSGDGYLYALNTNTHNLAWKSGFTLNLDVEPPIYSSIYNFASPTIANGVVYVGGGVQYGSAAFSNDYYAAQGQSTPAGANGGGIRMMAFDAATGASIWNQSRAGNTNPLYYPAVINGAIYAPEFFEITKMDATNPNTTGTVDPTPDFNYNNRRNGVREWAAWLGYQIQGSIAYTDDLTGDKIYAGSDIGSVYCLNATDGSTWSVFTAGGNVPCSPSIWEGKMYIGTTDGRMYCFDDSPTVDFNLYAASNKGAGMWSNETLSIGGRLTASPTMSVWNYDTLKYEPVASEYQPGLPGATVIISFNRPDGSAQNVTATTDKNGYFTLNYNPTQVGEWGWVAFYEGKRTVGVNYNAAYSEFSSIAVDLAPSGNQQTPSPTESPTIAPASASAQPTEGGGAGLPIEYVYAIVAVIVVVILVVAAYVYTKRK